MTRQIERFKRILMLIPSPDALPFDDCTCTSKGDPSAWFHKPHCPVCIEYWQHQAAACDAVDDAMADEQLSTTSSSEHWA